MLLVLVFSGMDHYWEDLARLADLHFSSRFTYNLGGYMLQSLKREAQHTGPLHVDSSCMGLTRSV